MKQKAYTAYLNFDNVDLDNNLDVIFAQSAREAKNKFIAGETFYGNEWEDAKDNGAKKRNIEVYRTPELDGYANSTILTMSIALIKFDLTTYYDPITQDDLSGDDFTKVKQERFEKEYIDDCNNLKNYCNQCNKSIKMTDTVYYTNKLAFFCSEDCLLKYKTKGKTKFNNLHTYFNYY